MWNSYARSLFAVALLAACFAAQSEASFCLSLSNTIGVPGSTIPSQNQSPLCFAQQPPYSIQNVYAVPPEGYYFSHWTGDLQGVADVASWKLSLTMDRNRSVVAHFVSGSHRTMKTRGFIRSSPLLYDINHDGYKEIIVGDESGFIYCFDRFGNVLWEYYAGRAFDKSVSPVPDWFNPEVKQNDDLGDIIVQSSPAAGDIDGDGLPEIIVGVGGFQIRPGQGGILILSAEGALKLLIRGYDSMSSLGAVQDGYSEGCYSTPALSDLNADGKLDFIIGCVDQSIYAYRISMQDVSKDGFGRTVRFFHPYGKDGYFAAPLFELDDDGDGKFNEDPAAGDSTVTTPYNGSDDTPGFAGVDDDGDGMVDEGAVGDDDEDSSSGVGVDWKKVDEDEFEWPFRNHDTVISSPAVADIDGDGLADVIIGADSSGGSALKPDRKFIPSGGALRVLNGRAEEVGSFPQWVEQVLWSSPAVADLDNDGKVEIFIGTGPVMSDGKGGFAGKGLYAFRSNGTAFIPGKVPYGLFGDTEDIILSSPAIGDINGDGQPEVVAVDFKAYVYAWNAAGTRLPGFPTLPLAEFAAAIGGSPHAQVYSSPILADVDGDGVAEIVVGVGWSIVAVKGNGQLVPTFRFGHAPFTTGTAGILAAPAAADLDNNGKIDLVWATGDSPDGGLTVSNGVLHVWELGTFSKDANPWPMFKRTGTRTSSYTVQFENPVFSPSPQSVLKGQNFAVSVIVHRGRATIDHVYFKMDINGSPVSIEMFDDGRTGDAVAGDGRYSAAMKLPAEISSIGGMIFSAQSSGRTVEMKADVPFRRIALFNLITKYYGDILERQPSSPERDGWVAEVDRITGLGIDLKEGLQALARLFFNSEEYRLRGKTDVQFVTDLYQTFLNRDPDPGGLTYWSDYLGQGLARDMLIIQFVNSNEFSVFLNATLGGSPQRPENNLVNDFYRGFLNRFPDTGGFNLWLEQMWNAQCSGAAAVTTVSKQIATSFSQSAEYAARARSDTEFVEDLYNGILRRGADAAGFNAWVGKLKTGTPRIDVLNAFIASPEFANRVNDVIAAGCLR